MNKPQKLGSRRQVEYVQSVQRLGEDTFIKVLGGLDEVNRHINELLGGESGYAGLNDTQKILTQSLRNMVEAYVEDRVIARENVGPLTHFCTKPAQGLSSIHFAELERAVDEILRDVAKDSDEPATNMILHLRKALRDSGVFAAIDSLLDREAA